MQGGGWFASAARICQEGLEGMEGMEGVEGRGERFDSVDSEVRCFIEEGGWEEKSGVGVFVRVLVEGHG